MNSFFNSLNHLSHSLSTDHNLKNLLISQVHTLVWFYLFGTMLYHYPLYHAFGFVDTYPVIIGMTLFSILYSPVEHVLSLAMNFLSRHYEYQADAFSTKLGYNLGPALIR